MSQKKIVVVGGGAGGMVAAIAAARENCKVILLEAGDRVGKKILATGNGKCNFSNSDMRIRHYYGRDLRIPEKVLGSFGLQETLDFFGGLGMLVREKGGCLYPASEQASTVLDLLRMELDRCGVEVRCGARVSRIIRAGKAFLVHMEADKTAGETGEKGISCDRVILACGGCAAPKTGSDGSGFALAKGMGHSIVPAVPALVQLRCREKDLKAVAGVRAQADVRLLVDDRQVSREQGELQLTDYGISGIVVFQLSRTAAYGLAEKKQVRAQIDLLPDWEDKDFGPFIENRIRAFPDRTLEEWMTGVLNKKLIHYFIRLAGLKTNQLVRDTEVGRLEKLMWLCRKWTLQIEGTNSYDNAQTNAGGVPFGEVTEGLESRKMPGVYFAGEILDIDGKCGGYNLQWAWSSGYTAGKNAAKG